jgi:hypothetical protein
MGKHSRIILHIFWVDVMSGDDAVVQFLHLSFSVVYINEMERLAFFDYSRITTTRDK